MVKAVGFILGRRKNEGLFYLFPAINIFPRTYKSFSLKSAQHSACRLQQQQQQEQNQQHQHQRTMSVPYTTQIDSDNLGSTIIIEVMIIYTVI